MCKLFTCACAYLGKPVSWSKDMTFSEETSFVRTFAPQRCRVLHEDAGLERLKGHSVDTNYLTGHVPGVSYCTALCFWYV